MDSTEHRFWVKVNIGNVAECWEWRASCSRDGYGQLQVGGRKGRRVSAHRLSWELHNGKIPDGLHVCHKCDNKLCVNPAHLFLGTNADNMLDWKKKGLSPKGEKNPMSKLTEDVVREIRRLSESGWTQRDLIEKFGVSQSSVSNIIHRKNQWAWLE